MDYNFAKRIHASMQEACDAPGVEIDAVTYPQFLKWELSEQAQYLRDHPGSKFGKYRDKGMTELVPRAEKKRLAEQRRAAQQQAPAPTPAPAVEKRRADDLGLKRVTKPARSDEEFMDEWNKDNSSPADRAKRAGAAFSAVDQSTQKGLLEAGNVDEMLVNRPRKPEAGKAYMEAIGSLIGADLNPQQHKQLVSGFEKLSVAYNDWADSYKANGGDTPEADRGFELAGDKMAALLRAYTKASRIDRLDPLQLLRIARGAVGATPKSDLGYDEEAAKPSAKERSKELQNQRQAMMRRNANSAETKRAKRSAD